MVEQPPGSERCNGASAAMCAHTSGGGSSRATRAPVDAPTPHRSSTLSVRFSRAGNCYMRLTRRRDGQLAGRRTGSDGPIAVDADLCVN